jgi:hypothetical protein
VHKEEHSHGRLEALAVEVEVVGFGLATMTLHRRTTTSRRGASRRTHDQAHRGGDLASGPVLEQVQPLDTLLVELVGGRTLPLQQADEVCGTTQAKEVREAQVQVRLHQLATRALDSDLPLEGRKLYRSSY